MGGQYVNKIETNFDHFWKTNVDAALKAIILISFLSLKSSVGFYRKTQ